MIMMISVFIVCLHLSQHYEQTSTTTSTSMYLINEFPSLSHAFSHIHNTFPSIYNIIKQYEPIIGYFSLPTQMNLSQCILHQIQRNDTSSLFSNFNFTHFLNLEKIALKRYLHNNNNRLFTGVGCIKAISLKYFSQNNDNENIMNVIYHNIARLIVEQIEMNKHEHTFINDIYSNVLSKQRQMLKDNNTEHLITVINTRSKEVKHVGYKYKDVVSVVRMVRRFSKEKQKHLRLVYHRVMLCMNMLSKLNGCSNGHSANSSSNSGSVNSNYTKQEIKYKSNTIVGITNTNSNDRDNYRITQNNFSHKHFTMNKMHKYINIALHYCKDNATLTSKLSLLLPPKEEYNYEHIYNTTLIPFANIDEIYENDPTLQYQLNITNTERGEIYIYCEKPLETTNERIIDFFVLNATTKQKIASYGLAYAKHIQTCMSVFLSGGKEDKDLCRCAMNQQCGMEVDYKCKQSGLFDFINEHPVSLPIKNVLKYPNDDNKMKYLEWVNHVLIKGTIAISPTAMYGYALEEQRFSEGKVFERNAMLKGITVEEMVVMDGSGNNNDNDNESNENNKDDSEDVGNENEYRELIDMSYVKLVNGNERVRCKWNYMIIIIILLCVIV